MLAISYITLHSGERGIKSAVMLTPGNHVLIRNGKSTHKERIGRILWTNGNTWIATIMG
jgi:hypothetical protein